MRPAIAFTCISIALAACASAQSIRGAPDERRAELEGAVILEDGHRFLVIEFRQEDYIVNSVYALADPVFAEAQVCATRTLELTSIAGEYSPAGRECFPYTQIRGVRDRRSTPFGRAIEGATPVLAPGLCLLFAPLCAIAPHR